MTEKFVTQQKLHHLRLNVYTLRVAHVRAHQNNVLLSDGARDCYNKSHPAKVFDKWTFFTANIFIFSMQLFHGTMEVSSLASPNGAVAVNAINMLISYNYIMQFFCSLHAQIDLTRI